MLDSQTKFPIYKALHFLESFGRRDGKEWLKIMSHYHNARLIGQESGKPSDDVFAKSPIDGIEGFVQERDGEERRDCFHISFMSPEDYSRRPLRWSKI